MTASLIDGGPSVRARRAAWTVVPWNLALALLSACGTRTSLEAPDASAGQDVVDRPTPLDLGTCTPRWSACRPVGTALNVSQTRLGQEPDVTWTGSQLLVVFDGPGPDLVSMDLDGRVRWREDSAAGQGPRISWNLVLGVGMVVSDAGLRWLGADGRPVGSRIDAGLEGSGLHGAAVPTRTGFLVVSGTNGYSRPPELYVAPVGATPGPVAWQHLASGSPRSAPEYALGAEGLGTSFVSTVWHGAQGALYPLDMAGRPRAAVVLDGVLPARTHVTGLVAQGDRQVVLVTDTATYAEHFVTIDGGVPGAAWRSPLQCSRSAGGHLVLLGDTLLAAAESTPAGVGVAVVEIVPGASPQVGRSLLVGGRASQSPRMAVTPRGLAVVYNEATGATMGLSAFVQVFDCCG